VRKKVRLYFFLKRYLGLFNWAKKWGPIHISKYLLLCHLSTDMWARDVRNRVNLLLDGHLLKLQKITPGVVDLRSKNVKWYHFVNFATKVVVLCYSLTTSIVRFNVQFSLTHAHLSLSYVPTWASNGHPAQRTPHSVCCLIQHTHLSTFHPSYTSIGHPGSHTSLLVIRSHKQLSRSCRTTYTSFSHPVPHTPISVV
jgi:hypothetical protein